MLSDKQIQEISKSAADIASSVNAHPSICLTGIINTFCFGYEERKSVRNRCMQWLFDNQQAYPFSIIKEDMLY